MTGDEGPTGRVLTLLERLQERAETPGKTLATALDVDIRTVRRYVALLQSLGIPVEARRGRDGGYRLGSGYRMPPLMLSTDEAVAVSLALYAVAEGEARAEAADPDQSDPTEPGPASTALAKINRVLPRGVADRVETVRSAISAPRGFATRPDRAPAPAVLMTLCEGVVSRRSCRIQHVDHDDERTVREVNPYGVVALHGGWYVHAWCHLRQARRTFRVDRIRSADLLGTTFSAPSGLDVVAAVQESLALSWPDWQVELVVSAPLAEVAHWIPRDFGLLDALGPDRTRMRASTSNLTYFALRVSELPFDVSVVTPPELAKMFTAHGERMVAVGRRYAEAHD